MFGKKFAKKAENDPVQLSKHEMFKLKMQELGVISGKRSQASLVGEKPHMSSLYDLALVHVTDFPPKTNSKGQKYIETHAMATDNKFPRASIHYTFNHLVQSHAFGNWDDKEFVIITPFLGMLEANPGLLPEEASLFDTYFFPDPDIGMMLPKSARIVRPAKAGELKDGELYKLNKDETIFKAGDYTDREKEYIVRHYFFYDYQKKEYESCITGNIPNFIPKIFAHPAVEKMYESSKDKAAFLRGMFSERAHEMLFNAVRDAAAKMTIIKMGYKLIHPDPSDYVSNRCSMEKEMNFRDNMAERGLKGVVGERSHSCHLSCFLEKAASNMSAHLYGGETNLKRDIIGMPGLLQMDNFTDAFNLLTQYGFDESSGTNNFINSIIDEVPLKTPDFGKIENKNLAKVMERWQAKIQADFELYRLKIKNMPGYDKFIEKLKEFRNSAAMRQAMHAGSMRE